VTFLSAACRRGALSACAGQNESSPPNCVALRWHRATPGPASPPPAPGAHLLRDTARERRAHHDGRRWHSACGAEHERRVSITRRSFWLTPRAKAQVRGGAMTSRCALRPLMVCPVSSWTHAKGQCKLRRSRLRVTSYGRCTWCAIRTNYATWRGRDRRAVPNERGFVDSSCGNARPERHRAGSPGRISGNWSVYL